MAVMPYIILLTLLISLPLSLTAQELDCGPQNIDRWTQARIAQAGNLLIIGNQQYVLAGVYAPDMGNPSNRSDPPRPMSRDAQRLLNSILANNDRKIGIEYDQQPIDRFGRRVAHLFLQDGTNINQQIIAQGMGMGIAHPPNLNYQECYFNAENQAREQQRGIWSLTYNAPELKFPIALSQQLSDMDGGFRIIRGKVHSVSRSRNHYMINLDTTGIRVQREHWPLFSYRELERLLGQTIEVRGYGFAHKGAMFVIIEHPHMINRLNPYHES